MHCNTGKQQRCWLGQERAAELFEDIVDVDELIRSIDTRRHPDRADRRLGVDLQLRRQFRCLQESTDRYFVRQSTRCIGDPTDIRLLQQPGICGEI